MHTMNAAYYLSVQYPASSVSGRVNICSSGITGCVYKQ